MSVILNPLTEIRIIVDELTYSHFLDEKLIYTQVYQ